MCMHLPLMVACAGLVVTQIRQFVLVQTSKKDSAIFRHLPSHPDNYCKMDIVSSCFGEWEMTVWQQSRYSGGYLKWLVFLEQCVGIAGG